jgi:hypothetical protein
MTVLQNYWQKWLHKRIPASAAHQLNHQNIFIFPARFGLLFVLLCGLLFLLGTNYQNNLMLILCYFLLAVFLVNLLASYINFARIELQIGKCPEVFVGDNLQIPLWLKAHSDLHPSASGLLHFKFQGQRNKQQKAANYLGNKVVDVDAFSNPINLSHKCQTRGSLNLSRVTVQSYYPLGLYKCWTHLAFSHQITVYPKPLPCEIQLFVSQHSSIKTSGELANEHSGHDDFSHLKAYQLGEPLNHVAWKQLAKGRGLVSKQFSSTSNQIGWLKLPGELKNTKAHESKNTMENTGQSGLQSQSLKLEKALGELCYQVLELSRTQRIFGLDLGVQCIVPNSGSEHRAACLHALSSFETGGS